MHFLIGIAVEFVLSLIAGMLTDLVFRWPGEYSGMAGLLFCAWSAWGITRYARRGFG